jgi:TolA-binding protein
VGSYSNRTVVVVGGETWPPAHTRRFDAVGRRCLAVERLREHPAASMAPRVFLPALLALQLPIACATTATTSTASAPTTTTPTAAATTPTASEVLVLRERVTRLEKRLADVDARLGLLLARADARPVDRAPLRFDAPRGEQPAVDLMAGVPGFGSGDVPSSIDIDRGTRAPGEDDVTVDGAPLAEIDDAAAGDEPVVLRLRGTPDAPSAGAGTADAPLATLTTAEALYEWGQARVKESRHLEAIAAFEDVVGRFPKDPLADNAVYWTGFCHQARNDHRLAIDVWQKLPLRFPRSDKIADALFGTAVSHEALGEPALAEALYDEVVHSYPKAEKARDARKALTRLRPAR